MGKVRVPLITSNRINTPEVAETGPGRRLCRHGQHGPPLPGRSHFVAKARQGRAREIAPCIACNQACLDHTFGGKLTSCLVNPRACHDDRNPLRPRRRTEICRRRRRGAPRASPPAIEAARRGHRVTLFERDSRIGGQLNMARVIPGKEEFHGLVDWFAAMLSATGVTLRLGTTATADILVGYDEIIIATGVRPRDPAIPGQHQPHVARYTDIFRAASPQAPASPSSARAVSASTSPNTSPPPTAPPNTCPNGWPNGASPIPPRPWRPRPRRPPPGAVAPAGHPAPSASPKSPAAPSARQPAGFTAPASR